jgi:hypothetical protein
LSGIDRLRAVSASKAVVNASVCEAVSVNCGILTLGPKARGWRILADDIAGQRVLHAGQEDNLRQRLAANGAEFGREVLRLLHAVDFVAGRASQFNDQLASMGDLLRAGRIQMNARAVVGIRFCLQKSNQRGDLLRREAVCGMGVVAS